AERLWITDAYLIAPAPLYASLIDAAKSGVDVRLLVPGASDLPILRNFTRVGYRDLLRAGVRVFEYAGPMIHAKTMLVDRRWARVGSSNLNVSSLLTNYEIDLAAECEALTGELANQFRRDLASSREIVLQPPQRAARIAQQDEADLVVRAAAGDRAAFGVLVERYAGVARRVARAVLGSPEDADDAAQDALLSALVKLDQYDPRRPFGPWLLRFVANAATDRRCRSIIGPTRCWGRRCDGRWTRVTQRRSSPACWHAPRRRVSRPGMRCWPVGRAPASPPRSWWRSPPAIWWAAPARRPRRGRR